MEPMRYRPPANAIDILLMLSGFLRDLGTDSSGLFLAPHITNVTAKSAVQNMVRASLREINTTAGKDDDLRLTLRLSKAQEMLELLRDAAKANPAIVEILDEKREYGFNEFLPGGKKVVTLAGMLDELGTPDLMGNAPCMHYVGGQLQDYIAWLAALPERPKK